MFGFRIWDLNLIGIGSSDWELVGSFPLRSDLILDSKIIVASLPLNVSNVRSNGFKSKARTKLR